MVKHAFAAHRCWHSNDSQALHYISAVQGACIALFPKKRSEGTYALEILLEATACTACAPSGQCRIGRNSGTKLQEYFHTDSAAVARSCRLSCLQQGK